jgi:hypothetical protein
MIHKLGLTSQYGGDTNPDKRDMKQDGWIGIYWLIDGAIRLGWPW